MLDILIRAACYVAIIVLGYMLRRFGFFGPEAFGVLAKVVLKITLPAAIVSTSAGRGLDPGLLIISLLSLGVAAVYMLVAWMLNRKKTQAQKAFAILNLPGYNIGTFALPFTQSFLGPTGVIATNLFDVGNSFVCLGGAYAIASAVKEGSGVSFKRVLKSAASSVALITHLIMVTLNLCNLQLPAPVVSLAQTIGNANAFLAMLMLGVGFRLSWNREQLGFIAKHLAVRYGLAVVFAALFYFALPFGIEVRRALVILAFSPFASAIPVFTAELKEDAGLSAAINSISIVVSIVCMMLLLMVML